LSGPGRLPEVDALLTFIDGILEKVHQDLRGRKVLVTAGPTQEAIDPVRYISNHSSGRMGFALAGAAGQRGADVTLVSGPVHLRTPRNTRRIDVQTAREMEGAIDAEFPAADLLIMAAAVADFAPVHAADHKLKRDTVGGERMTIELAKNPDILKKVGNRKSGQTVVGFALETEDGVKNAQAKLAAKHLDAIVLNYAGEEGAGFGTETNVVTFLSADGRSEKLPKMSKFDVANAILDRVIPLMK
jgi:phosphopantothenoylcysteine decarboxylase/phosphopantothenate--cysteine ligase